MPFIIDDLALAAAASAAAASAGTAAASTIPAWLTQAAAAAALSAGTQAAMPKYGMSNPQGPQQLGGDQAGMMDFNQLVQQQRQSQLPKLQLQNRLPQRY